MKNIFTLLVVLMVLSVYCLHAYPVFALGQDIQTSIKDQAQKVGTVAYGEQSGEGDLLVTRVGGIIKTVLGFLGVIFVILVVYAGFLWMTSGGGDAIKKAKGLIVNAVIGLAITLSAYAISDFVINKLIEASNTN